MVYTLTEKDNVFSFVMKRVSFFYFFLWSTFYDETFLLNHRSSFKRLSSWPLFRFFHFLFSLYFSFSFHGVFSFVMFQPLCSTFFGISIFFQKRRRKSKHFFVFSFIFCLFETKTSSKALIKLNKRGLFWIRGFLWIIN